MLTKQCKLCNEKKSHRNKPQRPGEHMYCCIACEAKHQRVRNEEKKRYIVYTLGGKCSICDIVDHPCIYDAHHIDQDKKTNSCSLINGQVLENELKKCKLVCVRCHRKIKHESRRPRKGKYISQVCKKCGNNEPHKIRKYRSHIDTQNKRQQRNFLNQEQMLKKWELGRKIHKVHTFKSWTTAKWNVYCKNHFGFGERNAYDYEKLFCQFNINNLPSSLNSVRTKKYNSNLIDEQNLYYVHNICVKCVNKTNRERKNKIKQQSILYKKGTCYSCQSIVEPESFDFHHVDPSIKELKISSYSSFDMRIKHELDKCVMLCCYCHRKVHSNVMSIIDPLDF